MSRFIRILFAVALSFFAVPMAPARADVKLPPQGQCADYIPGNGAIHRYCLPVQWNGDLVVYAHGYVAPDAPVVIPEDQLWLPDGTYVPALVTGLGFAFATTSYPVNGLAVAQAIPDLELLVKNFKAMVPSKTAHVYLLGVSEGGLITALSIEKRPGVYSGGLATCGPIGDFRRQVNYFGDFRVAYDFFYPGILPPSPIDIPPELYAAWKTGAPQMGIAGAIQANPAAAIQLLGVTRAAIDKADPYSVITTVVGVLGYNVVSTNNGKAVLGGNPYDNTRRLYYGSGSLMVDRLLNVQAQRFPASPVALDALEKTLETSGRLQRPLVSMHTTGDPIIPAWHVAAYALKTWRAGNPFRHATVLINRYGHCAFTASEALFAFNLLVWKATGSPLSGIMDALPSDKARAEYVELAAKAEEPALRIVR